MSKQSPEQEARSKYLESKKILVMDSSTSKSTIRKVLTEMGAKNTNLEIVENFSDAVAALQKTQHTIVWADQKGDNKEGRTGFDLFNELKKIHPDRLSTVFVIMGDNESSSLAAKAAEEDCDAYIVRPFTYDVLQKKIEEILKIKIKPTEYMKQVEAAKALIESKKNDDALTLLTKIKTLDPSPFLAVYYEGIVHKLKGNTAEAEKLFTEATQINPEHYKSFAALFEIKFEKKLFKDAFDLNLKLFTDFPTNPKYIPKFMWLAVYHKKLEDIVSFYDSFALMEHLDEGITTSIAAGMIICGKSLIAQNNINDAVEAFKKADSISKGKQIILREIISALIFAGAESQAKPYYTKASEEVRNSKEVFLAEIQNMINTKVDPTHIMTRCQDAIKLGHKHPSIYENLLKYSVALKRSNAVIDDLLGNAVQAFPDKKEFFEKLAKGS